MSPRSEIEKSHLRLVSMALTHAARFRLASFNTDHIEAQRLADIGREIVDLVERRLSEAVDEPPQGGMLSRPHPGGRSARQRGRGR